MSALSCFVQTIKSPKVEGRAMGTYVSFVSARLKDEFLRLMVPVLDGGVRRGQTGGPQGQTRLSMPFLVELLEDKT